MSVRSLLKLLKRSLVAAVAGTLNGTVIGTAIYRRDRRRGRHGVTFCRGVDALEVRQLLVATSLVPLPDVHVPTSGETSRLTLSHFFDDPEVTGSTVQLDTVLGNIIIETYDEITPVTAQNFVDLTNAGSYDNMFLHRSDPVDPLAIIQGGGFRWPDGSSVEAVPNNGTVVNEFDRWFDPEIGGLEAGTPLNVRGTVAMAKVANNPDSATSQWFINMSDNASILDPQNGGFTVFGRVLFDGMTVVDAIGDLEIVNAQGVFAELPIQGEVENDVLRENLIFMDTHVVSELTYAVTGNSNPELVTPSIVDGQLQLVTNQGVAGTTYLTVTATDLQGNVVTEQIEVAVEAPLSSSITAPGDGVERRPVFTFTESTGATHYELWVNRTGGPAAIIREQTLTSTSFTPGEDLPTGDYVVWVRAYNGQASAVWSAASSFSIGLEAATITTSGGETSDNTPTIEWTASNGATEYDVWVNHIGVENQVIRTRVSGTSFTPTEPLLDGEYRIWVQAEDDNVQAAWSNGLTFEVVSTGRLIAPVGTQSTARPEIQWKGPAGTYELWVNQVGGAARVVHETAIEGFAHTPSVDLGDGEYRGWVRLRNPGQTPGAWSAAFSFVVASSGVPGRGEITSVSDNTSPLFTWNAIENAVRYELWVNQNGGTPRVIHLTDLTALTYTATEVLAAGGYRAWLRGFSESGTAGDWSAAFAFTVS
ncbi:MAG: peptidylprolyl isomerase [Planctomycetaceae bacterium]|nr:peptidylprolyl isomerase [Planctomycetaceae bacterium]